MEAGLLTSWYKLSKELSRATWLQQATSWLGIKFAARARRERDWHRFYVSEGQSGSKRYVTNQAAVTNGYRLVQTIGNGGYQSALLPSTVNPTSVYPEGKGKLCHCTWQLPNIRGTVSGTYTNILIAVYVQIHTSIIFIYVIYTSTYYPM